MKGNSGKLVIALAGNPNSGKTTLFNALTGSTQRVGNWPGVTVEKKSGVMRLGERSAEVVDLPGIYSLSSHSDDERVAGIIFFQERPTLLSILLMRPILSGTSF